MIGHRDFKSMYPSIMRTRKLPYGKPVDVDPRMIDIDKILKLYPEYTHIVKLRLTNLSIRDVMISMPFFQKCKAFEIDKGTRFIEDNGRVLYAYDGTFVTYMDNRTLDIIVDQYTFDYEILACVRFKNDSLPAAIARVVDKYFKEKSDAKNAYKEACKKYGHDSKEARDAYTRLDIAKKRLNSIYGCCATKHVKDNLTITQEMGYQTVKSYSTLADYEDALEESKAFLPYQIGIMITAEARHELFEYIKAIGYENCYYCDTDSIFYYKTEKTEKAIKALNDKFHKAAPYVVLENGKKEYYDEFTAEEDCLAFRGLHSKCYGYVYEDKDGPAMSLTIAGVSARTIVDVDDKGEPVYVTREEELSKGEKDPFKALSNLTDGFKFVTNAGTTALYTYMEPQRIHVDGHLIETCGGCIIKKSKHKFVNSSGVYKEDDYCPEN